MFTKLRIFLSKWINQDSDKKNDEHFELFREDIIELSKIVDSKFKEIESKSNNSDDIISLNTILKKALKEANTDLELENIYSSIKELKTSIDKIFLNLEGFKTTIEQFPKDTKSIQTSLDKNKSITDTNINEINIKINSLSNELIDIKRRVDSMEYLIPVVNLITETYISKNTNGEIKGVSLTQDSKQANMNKSLLLPNGTTIFLKTI